jgi:hypothetical protein
VTLRQVAALFVKRGGPYFSCPGVDPWDITRNALLYEGDDPIVAHPPCARWCLLASFVEAVHGHRKGEDGGLFAFALETVRRCGGVLEHPAWTAAWPAYGLPDPPDRGGWQREMFGPGWVCSVAQWPYGHRALKPTWLYYVGRPEPAALDWTRPKGEQLAWVGPMDRRARELTVQRLSYAERSRTPIRFRDALLEMARNS